MFFFYVAVDSTSLKKPATADKTKKTKAADGEMMDME